MRADRLLQIVSLLRTHGRLSATELAARLEVAPRTILRDMDALSAAGVPVYAERGRDGGFALLPGYRPAVEELTAAESQALLLSGTGAVSRMGMSAALNRALGKLSVGLNPELSGAAARAADRILVDPEGWFGIEGDDLPCFETVQRATQTDRRLRLRYRHRNATAAARRTVDPYGLLQAGRSWYLIAAHRGRPHTFRIDRIESAEVLPESFRRPAGLDLRALWQQLRSDWIRPPTVTVRIEIVDGLPNEAMIMLRAVGASAPRIAPGPPMIMETEVPVIRAGVAALAGLGGRVRVLDPPELIEALRRSLIETDSLYQESSSGSEASPVGQTRSSTSEEQNGSPVPPMSRPGADVVASASAIRATVSSGPPRSRSGRSARRPVTRRPGFGSAARDGRDDRHLRPVRDLGVQAADEADVLVADVEVHEATQRSAVVDDPGLDPGMGAIQRIQQLTDRGTVGADLFLAVGVAAQDGGDADRCTHVTDLARSH